MKQHIISLPHHPKRVITISLIIALAIGIFGYTEINKKVLSSVIKGDSNIDANMGYSSFPSQNLTLGFLAGGRIKSVSVKAGDKVKRGQVLAALDAENTLGSLIQAMAAYKTAQANYQKIINGATGSAIDVAKAAAHTAEINLDGVTKQQDFLVTNAHANFLNSTLSANLLYRVNDSIAAPSITGAYNKDVEGSIIFVVNQAGPGGAYISFSGIENGSATVSVAVPQAIGNTGLYIKFPSVDPYTGTYWEIDIPNKNAPNYLANYNAYQSSLVAKNQTISNAQPLRDQANASLVALSTAARPEDVAVAQAQMDNAAGAVQIAQATYKNTIITAPADGTVTSVAIAPGQIATPNAPAMEFISTASAVTPSN